MILRGIYVSLFGEFEKPVELPFDRFKFSNGNVQ